MDKLDLDTLPLEIIQAAEKLSLYFAERNIKEWKVGGVQSRDDSLIDRLRKAEVVRKGYKLVPIEPHMGPEYEAGNWSLRNWEAALRDQAAAAGSTESQS